MITSNKYFYFICSSILFLASCSYYLIDTRITTNKKLILDTFSNITQLYVVETNDSGYHLKESTAEAIQKDGSYKYINSLETTPKLLAQTAIIVPSIIEARYWEVNLETYQQKIASKVARSLADLYTSDENQPLIANALVKVGITINAADSGRVLYSNAEMVAYQQIYVSPQDIQKRVDGYLEINRLIKLSLSRLVFALNKKQTTNFVYFERGTTNQWWRKFIPGLKGDITITKGIRFAKAQKWENAIGAWLAAAFEPKTMPDPFFVANRASSYYNIGQIYAYNQQLDMAALYYSYANLINPKVKYAQAWADVITTSISDDQQEPLIDDEFIKATVPRINSKPQFVEPFPKPNFDHLLKKDVLLIDQ